MSKISNMIRLEELMVTGHETVDPSAHPSEVFELFSIPAYDVYQPDVIEGSAIGSAKKRVEPGDVLLSRIVPHIRRAWVVPRANGHRQIASGEWIVFRSTKFNASYLRHLLMSDVFHAQFMNTVAGVGGSLLRARPSFVADIEIPLPPLSEQKRIADILDKADAIRRMRREARSLTQSLSMAAFRGAFDKYLVADAAETVLSDVAEVVSGVAKGRKLNGSDTREVPYLRVANVQAGYLDLAEIKTIPAKESEVTELALQHGDVVMTEGGDFDKLGRGALWEHDVPDCIHQNHVFRVRADRRSLLPTFLVNYLQTEQAKSYFLRCAKKTTNLASINMTQLRALPVPLPPLDLQKRFDQELRTIADAVDRLAVAQKSADDLFGTLVQRAFRGTL